MTAAAGAVADAETLTALDEVAGLLDRPFADADRILLQVGEKLAAATETFGRLTATFGALPQALDSDEIRAATAHLVEVGRAVTAAADALSDETGVLARLLTTSREVGAAVERLNKTVGVISVLAINARVAAGHLVAEGEDVSVFTREIGRLAGAAESTVRALAQDQTRLDALLREACRQQAAFGSRYGETLHAAARQLGESLELMAARRARSVEMTAEVGERSKRIGAQVGVAVMALQIGDRTRQRLEHAAEAVVLLRDGLSDQGGGAGTWRAGLDEAQQRGVLSMACRLQSAQLSQALGDFSGEVRRVADSLVQLAGDAAAMAETGADLSGGTAGAGGLFDGLRSKIESAGTLMHAYQEARGEVDRMAAEAAATLEGLVRQADAVREVEADLRLVGLNTTLKCGRLGSRGVTLSAIAQELRACSDLTVRDTAALTAVLQDVVSAAEALRQQGKGAQEIAALQARTGGALATLDEAGARLGAAVAALAADGRRMSALLTGTAERLTVHEDLDRQLAAARDRLDAVGAKHAGGAVDPAFVEETVLSLFGRHYTMESERDIHKLLGTGDDRQPTEAAPEAPPQDSLDDIFF